MIKKSSKIIKIILFIILILTALTVMTITYKNNVYNSQYENPIGDFEESDYILA